MILLQLAHPNMNRSRANRAMLDALSVVPGLVVNDLYEHYPDFYIDEAREQELLRSADLVIFQFPIYWYAAPALLKQKDKGVRALYSSRLPKLKKNQLIKNWVREQLFLIY